MRQLIASCVAALVSVCAPAAWGGDGVTDLLVVLRPGAVCTHSTILRGRGAVQVSSSIWLWRLSAGGGSKALLERLRHDGALAFAEPDRLHRTAASSTAVARADFGDPLVAASWWRQTIGVAELTPPGPGVPVTIVDSGVDFAHEEFTNRANTTPVNAQEPPGVGGRHGTMVASVLGAPVNGVGLVGIYPEAVLRSYDARISDETSLATGQIVAGILAASEIGKGVINLSLGGSSRSLSIERAVHEAMRRGSLVVAAAGNSGDVGSALEYPAAVPHVFTVAATDQTDTVARFSSRSGFVDLAAPGVDIGVARPVSLGGPYSEESGTSFAAPLVSGAAAWIWTLRPELDASQVAEILRASARDVGAPGWDKETGHGILDVPAALALPTPSADGGEPNDDIEFVDPAGTKYGGQLPLTTASQTAATISARLTRFDDPRDVHRLWLPRRSTVTIAVQSDLPVRLQLFRAGSAATVLGTGAAVDRLATTATTTSGALTYTNRDQGRVAYVAVLMPRTPGRSIAYSLSVTSDRNL